MFHHARRGWFFVLTMGLAAILACPVLAGPPAVAKLQGLPASMGPFTSDGRIRTYGRNELGASLAYNWPEQFASVTVYLYDLGAGPVPDGIGAAVVRKAFAEAKAEIEQQGRAGGYGNLKLLKEATLTFPIAGLPDVATLFAVYAFETRIDADPSKPILHQSFLQVTGASGHIVKARATFIPFEGSEAARWCGWLARRIVEQLYRRERPAP